MSRSGGKGCRYYNNGIINKRFFEEDTIPEGWVPGFKKRSDEELKRSNEKRKKTCLEKYGVDAPSKSKEIQKKTEETNMKRYGVKAPSQNDQIKRKAVETSLERYGVENPAMSQEIKDKTVKTNLERYGYYSSAMAPEVKEKAKETCLQRYGAVSPSMNAEVIEKKKQTCLQNFGTEYPMESEVVREKSRQSCMDRYGTSVAAKSHIIKDRVKSKVKELYGGFTLESHILSDRMRKTMLERYGVENPSQSPEIQQKKVQTSLEHWGTENPSQSENWRRKIVATNLEKYGVPYACMRDEARAYTNDSSENREFAELLESYNIPYEREFHIKYYSYDFKIMNILLEIDPYPFHNTLWSPVGDHSPRINKDYHQKKSQVGEEVGFQVIHIFDWDDKDKIVQGVLLQRGEASYARKCELREVSKEETDSFLNKHHLQGTCRGQDIRLGLYLSDTLVSLMTFGKPRYNSNYEYELLRYVSSCGVIGGAQKLFTHFLREYQPQSIISYCDRSKFRGDIYSKLGFILLNEGKPSCHWYGTKDHRHITDNFLRQRGYDQIFNESYGKGTSNEELIIKRGYVPIYDCGQDTYVYQT